MEQEEAMMGGVKGAHREQNKDGNWKMQRKDNIRTEKSMKTI